MNTAYYVRLDGLTPRFAASARVTNKDGSPMTGADQETVQAELDQHFRDRMGATRVNVAVYRLVSLYIDIYGFVFGAESRKTRKVILGGEDGHEGTPKGEETGP